MIIEITKDSKEFKNGEKYLVLQVKHDFKSRVSEVYGKEIIYTVLFYEDENYFYPVNASTIRWVNYDECKIISHIIPSNWGFEICNDGNYFCSYFKPLKWHDKNWTYSFWETCLNDDGIDPLEGGRAEKYFFEEVKKIYEECGRGYIPDPFDKENA